MSNKTRLDLLLVERGLEQTRQRAQAMIMSGLVFVDGQRVDKAGTAVPNDAQIEVRGNTLRYVSRGGLKLEKAMTKRRDKGLRRRRRLRTARLEAPLRRARCVHGTHERALSRPRPDS